jgi:hypothetical protein
MFDSQSFDIPAHSEDLLTYEYARCAIANSVWRRNRHNWADVSHGIVPENDPCFGKPLTQEDIDAANPIIPSPTGENMSWKDAIGAEDVGVLPRHAIDPKSYATVGKS